MHAIPNHDVLEDGDVLHHPVFGFAQVTRKERDATRVRWETPGPHHPPAVGHELVASGYRRCAPGGFFARSVRDPDAARAHLARDPLGAVAELVHELGEPQREEDLVDWLLQRGLLTRTRSDAWLDALRPLIARDPRFSRDDGVLGLQGAFQPDAQARPVPTPGTLAPGDALPYAERLALAAANLHAAGIALMDRDGAIAEGPDGFVLTGGGPADALARREDVRRVMRAVLAHAVGPLPSDAQLGGLELVACLGGACPSLPPEFLAVLASACAPDPEHRPPDAFALARVLADARATSEFRARAGMVRGACAAAGFDTHVGLAKSLHAQTNQDSFVAVGEQDCALLAVCDGISQCNAGSGDLASALASRALRTHWNEHASTLGDATDARVSAWIADALTRANHAVCDGARRIAGADLERRIPMGTTAVVAVTRGNRVHLASLGDSRAYLVGTHGVALLTTDHNATADVIREGFARGGHTTDGNEGWALTRFLGHFDEAMQASLPAPFERTVDLLPGEWLILCSDGFTDYAADDEAGLARILRDAARKVADTAAGPAAMELARRLVSAANRGGGGDNVTVVALTLTAPAADRPA
ncbi:MAG: hypothetical protein RLZZ299_2062 [Pseudomonadota bacterium]